MSSTLTKFQMKKNLQEYIKDDERRLKNFDNLKIMKITHGYTDLYLQNLKKNLEENIKRSKDILVKYYS